MTAVTEDEAKMRWCQEAVASHTDPRAGFRHGEESPQSHNHICIASRCMAWRWKHRVLRHIDKLRHIDNGNDDVGESGPATGYCGKAGQP